MNAREWSLFEPGRTYVTRSAFKSFFDTFKKGEQLVFVRSALSVYDNALGYFFKDERGRDRRWDISWDDYDAVRTRLDHWFVPVEEGEAQSSWRPALSAPQRASGGALGYAVHFDSAPTGSADHHAAALEAISELEPYETGTSAWLALACAAAGYLAARLWCEDDRVIARLRLLVGASRDEVFSPFADQERIELGLFAVRCKAVEELARLGTNSFWPLLTEHILRSYAAASPAPGDALRAECRRLLAKGIAEGRRERGFSVDRREARTVHNHAGDVDISLSVDRTYGTLRDQYHQIHLWGSYPITTATDKLRIRANKSLPAPQMLLDHWVRPNLREALPLLMGTSRDEQ